MPMKVEEINTKQEEFERLLLKTPLENYTQQLWDVFRDVASNNISIVDTMKENNRKAKAWGTKAISLAEQLLHIIKGKPIKIGKNEVTSTKAIEALKECPIEEYHNLYLNNRSISLEEAEAKISNWENDVEIRCFLITRFALYYKDVARSNDDIYRLIEGVHYKRVCEDYAFYNGIREEITPEQVEGKIRELNKAVKSLTKQGRKPRNLNLIYLILEIRKYHTRKTNKDYRLIFDCMNLLGLIDDEIIQDWQKKYNTESQINNAKASYIKVVYQTALVYESPRNRIKAIFLPFQCD